MGRIIKLVSYFYVYQTLFSLLFLLIEYNWEIPTLIDSLERGTAINQSTIYLSLAMVLSGMTMLWHLIHFQYVKFNLKSFGEVSGKTIGLSIPLIFSGMIFVNLCSEFIGLPDNLQDTFFALSSNLFGILSITIIAPLVEELLFRGAIQGYLLKTGMKPMLAIFISSFIFGVIHLNPAQVPFAFAIGLIFGWLYYRTASLIPGIIGHFINNSIACIQMILLSKEELNTKTIEWLGEGPTYALLAVSFTVMIGLFLYLGKKLSPAPVNSEEQKLKIKEETIMRNINFQTKASGKKKKDKKYAYINNVTYWGIIFALSKLATTIIKINLSTKYTLDLIISDICQIVALFICTTFIGIISYNVKRNQVFIETNANLIKAIGITISLTGPIPPFICMLLTNITLPNLKALLSYYPNWYLIVTGSFIYTIGYIYQYAIKMKEEQDLTI